MATKEYAKVLNGLTAKETKAIEALLTEPTIKDAAKTAGISYTQLRRWLEQPTFADAYKKARSIAFESTLAALQTTTQKAIQVLAAIMGDTENPASVRVNAAGKLLEAGFKSRELMDTEQRLAEIEARIAAMNQQPQGGR